MFTTKGRYALRVMIDLAEHKDQGITPLKEISERQEISKKYLEIIMRDLVAGELVIGKGGKGGGYRLSRPPEDYTVLEILELMEGTIAPVACLECGARPCGRESICKTLPMWKEFDRITHEYFAEKTLKDLL